MMIKRFLESLLKEKSQGPYPSFSILHLIKSLELIVKEGSVGRGRLSKELEIGVGVTRTLISRLKNAKLVIVSKSGCSLTQKGEKIWNELQSIILQKFEIEKSELTLGTYDFAVLIKGCGHKIKNGIKQRDVAIIAGANGATTLFFRKKHLILPRISKNVALDYPVAFSNITRLFELEENDVVVIGSANTLKRAEYGALAAAWSLIDDVSN